MLSAVVADKMYGKTILVVCLLFAAESSDARRGYRRSDSGLYQTSIWINILSPTKLSLKRTYVEKLKVVLAISLTNAINSKDQRLIFESSAERKFIIIPGSREDFGFSIKVHSSLRDQVMSTLNETGLVTASYCWSQCHWELP
jgi:hypothetical protein